MALRHYQTEIELNKLYNIRLIANSGLGETLKPRITSVGGLVTIYGSEEAPTGVTLANIATKMALIKDDVAIESFESIPNYIVVIQKSGTGTSTELVLTSIQTNEGVVIS